LNVTWYPVGLLSLENKYGPWTSRLHLVLERVDRQRRQRHLANTVGRLRVRDPGDAVQKIDVLLLHRRQFLVNAKPGFRDDPDRVSQVHRRDRLNPQLFRPGHVMRSEQAPDRDRELDFPARIRRQQSLADRDIQRAPQHAKLLMNRRWFDDGFLDHSAAGLAPRARTQSRS
jgi:hypothetical protein